MHHSAGMCLDIMMHILFSFSFCVTCVLQSVSVSLTVIRCVGVPYVLAEIQVPFIMIIRASLCQDAFEDIVHVAGFCFVFSFSITCVLHSFCVSLTPIRCVGLLYVLA